MKEKRIRNEQLQEIQRRRYHGTSESRASFVSCTVELYLSIFSYTQPTKKSLYPPGLHSNSKLCLRVQMVLSSIGLTSKSQSFYDSEMKFCPEIFVALLFSNGFHLLYNGGIDSSDYFNIWCSAGITDMNAQV